MCGSIYLNDVYNQMLYVVALAAAISCASLALSDGGIEMFDLAIGISLVCCQYTV